MYDVYVGNLPCTTTNDDIRKLFSQIGEIASVHVKQSRQSLNFAFVRFYDLDVAKNVCRTFNGKNFDGLIIKVRLAISTQQKLKNNSRRKKYLL